MYRKNISAILACLLLVTAFVAGGFGRLPSDSPYYQQEPMPEPITLYAVINSDPYWGYFHGYKDMMLKIKDNLIEIGINLIIVEQPMGLLWDIVVADQWNDPGDVDGDPNTWTWGVDGWDITCSDWIVEPNGYQWFPSTEYAGTTPDISGWNIRNWNNTQADYYLHKAMTTPDSEEHNAWMRKWQAEWMHDPPNIGVFYGEPLVGTASYLRGYDFNTVQLRTYHDFAIDKSKFEEVLSPGDTRYEIGNNTIIYGIAEAIYTWAGIVLISSAESTVVHMRLDNLYTASREHMDTVPPSGDFIMKPIIAADYPVWRDGPNGPKTIARIPLRTGINWTDGVPLNATDVAWTWNTITQSASGSAVAVEFPQLEWVEVVNETTVDFHFYEHMYGLESALSNPFGGTILPWHQLKDVPIGNLATHPSAYDPYPPSGTPSGVGLESSGPYVVTSYTPNVECVFTKRPDYWGSTYGIGTDLPDEFIFTWEPDEAARLLALKALEIDCAELMVNSVTDWKLMGTWDTHNVWQTPHTSLHSLWLNLDNPILSNRYVRLAIAYAIDYDWIESQILPGWGFNKTYPGKTHVNPWHDSFDDELGNYVYDVDVAKKYMDMWRYSQDGYNETADYGKGHVGDADLSGLVDLDDYAPWANNLGTNHTEWIFIAGQDIDPDHNNDDYVSLDDFFDGWEVKNNYWYPENFTGPDPAWYHW